MSRRSSGAQVSNGAPEGDEAPRVGRRLCFHCGANERGELLDWSIIRGKVVNALPAPRCWMAIELRHSFGKMIEKLQHAGFHHGAAIVHPEDVVVQRQSR